MKIKFNGKLTLFLVGLFLSFIFIILGGKIHILQSVGFICLGGSIFLFLLYYNDYMAKSIESVDNDIDEIEEITCVDEIEEQQKTFAMKELYQRKVKIEKKFKKSRILFCIFAVMLIVLGFILMR